MRTSKNHRSAGDHMSTDSKKKPAPRCALITGASQGLGKAIAEDCARRGMDLFLIALPDGGLPEVAEEGEREHAVRADYLEIDLTDDHAVDGVISKLESNGFEIDLLVNNAGIGSIGFFSQSPMSGHEATMQINMLALVHLTHRLIPDLKSREPAYILNVSSLGAFFPMPSLPVYSATKSFVLTFTLALREELHGTIGVSALCPNTIRNDRETEEYVDRLPFICRIACLYPAEIARTGIDELLRGKAIIVPGAINKMLRVLGPFIPHSVAAAMIRRLWGGFQSAHGEADASRV